MRIGLIVGAALLAGCSTDPESFTYHSISADKAMPNAPAQDTSADAAPIVIRREPALGGWGLDYIFLIDDRRVVTLQSGEEFEYRLAPGEYNFGVLCPGPFGDMKNQMVTEVKPRQAYRVRLYATPMTACHIETTKVLR